MSQNRVVPHTRPAEWPRIAPGRFAERIRYDSPTACELALLGLPDDTGVRLNGGRPGAAAGPSAFRAALATYGTAWDAAAHSSIETRVFDAGDIEVVPGDDESALFETHARVEAAVRALHALGLIPICIGGGHDLSLPSITALSKHVGQPVGGINVDAHLDVRERVGSGMPFRRLIEAGALDPRCFVEFGLGRFANDAGDLAWLKARGATLVSVDQALAGYAEFEVLSKALLAPGSSAFLSVDLDVIDSAAAPGVSALNPSGLGVALVAKLAEACGERAGVRHFDIMELSPPWDTSGRSARVAAHLLLCFVAGFARRAR